MNIFDQERQQRREWRVAAVISTILVMGIAFLLQGCMTFEKAHRRYATNHVDTTYQTITTVVPRDSAVLRLVTDTTTVIREVRQGRARIIYQRTPQETTVRAECDSVVITKQVPVYITKQVWGIDPRYQRQAQDRLVLIWVLLGVIVLLALIYVFKHLFRLEVTKR